MRLNCDIQKQKTIYQNFNFKNVYVSIYKQIDKQQWKNEKKRKKQKKENIRQK